MQKYRKVRDAGEVGFKLISVRQKNIRISVTSHEIQLVEEIGKDWKLVIVNGKIQVASLFGRQNTMNQLKQEIQIFPFSFPIDKIKGSII